jgi:hypothetical protein
MKERPKLLPNAKLPPHFCGECSLLVHGPFCAKKINGFTDLDLKTTDNMCDKHHEDIETDTPSFHLCFRCHATLKIQEDISSQPNLPRHDDEAADSSESNDVSMIVPNASTATARSSKKGKVDLVAIYKIVHIQYTAEAINSLDKATAAKKSKDDSASASAALDPKKHTRLQSFLKQNPSQPTS